MVDIKQLISIFGIEIEGNEIPIYLGPREGGGEFTINIKDPVAKLDLSFYSRDRLPPTHLGWITSRETEILITQGVVYQIKPAGLLQHLQEHKITDPQFFINPHARDLILRLCFLNTIGEIETGEMEKALLAIRPSNPIDLLLQEFKIEMTDGLDEKFNHKMTQFMERHALDENLKFTLVKNLLSMAELNLSLDETEQTMVDLSQSCPHKPIYHQSLRDAFISTIVSLQEKLSKTIVPASTPNVGAAASGESLVKKEGHAIG